MNSEIINWKTFRQTLDENQLLELQFQYTQDKWVSPSYHITEIKQAPITSVDCGGVVNQWTEVIIQLWEPAAKQQERVMKARKALSIIELVEKSLQLDANAIVKIEFGNSEFDTRQMLPKQVYTNGDNLIVDLRPDTVQCKANDRGESCRPKPKVQLKNLASNAKSCTPGSGCC